MDIRHGLTLFLLLAPSLALAVPVANTDTRSVPQGVPITIDVLNNDFDDDGDSLSIVADSIVGPENGRVIVNSDGGIQYIPAAGFIGQDQFQYTVVDDSSAQETAVGTVIINVVAANISGIPQTQNELGVAQALDAICGELANAETLSDASVGTIELASRCEALSLLATADPDAAQRVIQQIAPEETLSLAKVGSNASQFQAKMVGSRMMQLGSGISTASQGGLSWSSQRGNGGGAAGDDSLFAKLGFFASMQLEDAEKDRSDAEAGFDYSANGLTMGMDYAINTDWFVGGALGLTSNDLDYNDNGGTVKADIATFIAFSTLHKGNFSFDLQLGGGNSNVDIARYMDYEITGFEHFQTKTKGQTSGSQWFLSMQTQYIWSSNALTLYPSAKLNYSGSRVKGYADNNAGGWEVVLGDQKVQRFSFETGIQATYAINTSWGVVIPNAEVNLIADLDTSQDMVTGYFAFAPTNSLSFGMEAEDPDSMYYQLGLGASAIFPGGNSGFVGLRQTLGYEDYSSLQFQVGLRLEF